MATSSSTRRILVTGGNKGIGRAICERLLSEWQDTHVILAARSPQRGQEAVEEIIKTVGESCRDRLEFLELDVSSDESVRAAAESYGKKDPNSLFGIINNAAVGMKFGLDETVNTNYFGPRRVNDAFSEFLTRPGGRIVNVASASGPNYISSLSDTVAVKAKLAKPWTIGKPGDENRMALLDEIARNMPGGNAYGASKSLLSAYTHLHARMEPDLIINACSPGFIATDLTAGFGAKNPPSKGAIPPCFLLMDEETIPKTPTGRYYGSDCVRSPLDVYRDPGEPAYDSDEDLVGIA